jgi:hypothetical protein
MCGWWNGVGGSLVNVCNILSRFQIQGYTNDAVHMLIKLVLTTPEDDPLMG